MTMTLTQQIITIAMVVFGTMVTRFLPFLLFPANRTTPLYVQYLGRVLPPAVLGLLVIYCFKDVTFTAGMFGIPELIGVTVVAVLHLWKRNMMLSMAAGTVVYMVLVQVIFS